MTSARWRRTLGVAVAVAATLGLGAMSVPAGAAPSADGTANSGGRAGSNSQGSTNSASGETASEVCGPVGAGYARCLSWVRTDSAALSSSPATVSSPGAAPAADSAGATLGARAATLGNNGAYDPSYLKSAYGVYGSAGGSGQTVGIVDAYNDPDAASDLASYRSGFGLPACTTTSGCLRIVNETGGSSLPSANSGWAQEISLDLDMVSAICPNCHILLVEAASAAYSDLGTAVNTAVTLGADQVSNSYGGSEFSTENGYATEYYDHPGVAVVASSGDSGYGVEFPAASPYVTAAGGTTLDQTGNTGVRNATETAWSGAGSGCSVYEPKPSWQKDTLCAKRTVADVSADANPNTGVWVYDSYHSSSPWGIFGGTSVASPIIASFFALGGQAGPGTANPPSWPYAGPAGSLNDIVSGSNGSCGGTYLCTALVGYDGPTGLGTPDGTGAFLSSGGTGGGGTGGGGTNPPPGSFTLSASPDHSRGVDLSWTLAANVGASASSYAVYRSTSASGTFSPTGLSPTCTASACTAHDTATTSRTTYWYYVVATNNYGHMNSNTTSAKAR